MLENMYAFFFFFFKPARLADPLLQKHFSYTTAPPPKFKKISSSILVSEGTNEDSKPEQMDENGMLITRLSPCSPTFASHLEIERIYIEREREALDHIMISSTRGDKTLTIERL